MVIFHRFMTLRNQMANIDLKRLRHLQAVAVFPTVQAAADSLHITQSALTKSIARFEAELDAPLFDRKGHRLALTDLGSHLVQRGQSLLRQVQTLEEEIALWKGLGTGEAKIGADAVAEFGLLAEALERFLPAYPGVSVSIRSGHTETLLPALLDGELHFLVADPEIAQSDEQLTVCELVSSPLCAAVRPGHPLADNPQPDPGEVRQFPRIGASTAPRFERWREAQGRLEGGERLSRSLVSDNYGLLAQLAQRTDAIVFGPRNLLQRYEREGQLHVVSWPFDGPNTLSSLIRLKERHLPPAAEQLIEVLSKAAMEAGD
jgi:DNA-binding transcriptional LysR family regulator